MQMLTAVHIGRCEVRVQWLIDIMLNTVLDMTRSWQIHHGLDLMVVIHHEYEYDHDLKQMLMMLSYYTMTQVDYVRSNIESLNHVRSTPCQALVVVMAVSLLY